MLEANIVFLNFDLSIQSTSAKICGTQNFAYFFATKPQGHEDARRFSRHKAIYYSEHSEQRVRYAKISGRQASLQAFSILH
jgi:hypothetical protein